MRLAAAPAGQAVQSPRLDELLAIARAHAPAILENTVGTSVSPALVLAVIAVESGGRADAVSRVGAQGLMQLMPQTAADHAVTDALDPVQNIRGGISFLDVLMKRYGGDPILVLAAYNAGETRVAEHQGVPDIAETRDYVPKVLAAFDTARKLCMTPPILISDGCVFHLP
ncbi:lytic transglycosylase domain-containing protein [Pseudooceanicola aestuarii]|uniref:lytic transglycosylase domain-containing protein n=1 Tax=Pseudooceanicola aestuarii TaxID=2697319 RepID=UPI0030841CFC